MSLKVAGQYPRFFFGSYKRVPPRRADNAMEPAHAASGPGELWLYINAGNAAIKSADRCLKVFAREQTLARKQRLGEAQLGRAAFFSVCSSGRRGDVGDL